MLALNHLNPCLIACEKRTLSGSIGFEAPDNRHNDCEHATITYMILTVTLNAALDKTYGVSSFEPGGIYHTEKQHTSAGGKGINVARVAKTLGAKVMTTGFLGGQIGTYVEHLLAQDGLNPHFVPIANETRLCTAIVDPVRGVETKVNEQGPVVSETEAELFLKTLTELASRTQFIAFSGRLPLGIKPDFYADCIRIVQQDMVRVGYPRGMSKCRIA